VLGCLLLAQVSCVRVWEGVADCPSIEIIDFRDCVDVKVAPQYIESAIAKLSNLKEIHLRNLHVNDSTMARIRLPDIKKDLMVFFNTMPT
jgi:hypothetical protein